MGIRTWAGPAGHEEKVLLATGARSCFYGDTSGSSPVRYGLGTARMGDRGLVADNG